MTKPRQIHSDDFKIWKVNCRPEGWLVTLCADDHPDFYSYPERWDTAARIAATRNLVTEQIGEILVGEWSLDPDTRRQQAKVWIFPPEDREPEEFKVYVKADRSGTYASNGLKFGSIPEAVKYARDLFMRWTLVDDWAVIPLEFAGGLLADKTVDDVAVERMNR